MGRNIAALLALVLVSGCGFGYGTGDGSIQNGPFPSATDECFGKVFPRIEELNKLYENAFECGWLDDPPKVIEEQVTCSRDLDDKNYPIPKKQAVFIRKIYLRDGLTVIWKDDHLMYTSEGDECRTIYFNKPIIPDDPDFRPKDKWCRTQTRIRCLRQ